MSILFILILIILSDPIHSYCSTCKYKYATTTVNIRKSPNINSKIVGYVYWNEKINVVNKIDKKWLEIIHKGRHRFVSAKYFTNKQIKYKKYKVKNDTSFKSFEDADCITNNTNIPQGKIKKKYHLDYDTGLWMIGNRYCIAIGQFYTSSIGVKIDVVLKYKNKKKILRCITADCKAKKDTINNNKVHTDGSMIEFIVKTSCLSKIVKYTGNVSNAGEKFKGNIIEMRIYKED